MSDYEITNFELRVLLRHYWQKNLDAKAAAKAICDVEGEGTVAPRTAQKWFKRFNEGDLDLEDRINSCIKNHYFNTAHELYPQPNKY